MRILATHHKKNHPAWRRRVELLEDWEAASRKNWRVRKSAVSGLCEDLRWAWRLFRVSKTYDVLLTGSERPALMLALMQKLARGRARVPHVLLECMWNLPENGFGRWKRRLFLRWVAASTDRILVYARHQIGDYASILDVPEQKFAFVHSHSTLYESAYPTTNGDYIFSGGYTNRDYPTLFEAVRGLPYRTVVCVGSRQSLGDDVPANVEVRENLREDAFNRLMAASALVVVPLKGGVLEAGGRQVFQNAMTMGKAVIVTDLSAMDYITHGLTGLLVPPGNPVELRDAIVTLMCDHTVALNLGREAQRISADFTPERFFERIFAVIEEVVPQCSGILPVSS
jgi:glycosyltransferase involved in cell wall biosynthesis